MMMNVMRLVSVARNLHGCQAVQMDWWMPAASLLHWRGVMLVPACEPGQANGDGVSAVPC